MRILAVPPATLAIAALILAMARSATAADDAPSAGETAPVPADGTRPAPDEAPNGPAESDESAKDPTVPRGAVRSFLDNCKDGDYEKAATLLDVRNQPQALRQAMGPELARHLNIVLDRALWVDLGRLSDLPGGDPNDGLPDNVDRAGTIETARGPVDVLLSRSRSKEGLRTWKFASSTVDRLPALYEEFGYGMLGEVLPEPFFRIRFLEVQLWQWIGLLLLGFLSVLMARGLTWVAHRLARPFVTRTQTTLDDRILALLVRPTRLLLGIFLFWSSVRVALGLAIPAQKVVGEITKAATVLALTWFVIRMVQLLADVMEERLRGAGRQSALSVVPLGRRALKAVVAMVALLLMLQTFGMNVTGVIAGLGVGGLAVALAAQKSLENLFGGIMVITDQPVRVGDFCRFGDKTGTVEDVGLRSTRIRTLDRTVVTVPNAEFASIQIENFARRDRIRFYTKLGLRYETTPDQMRYVLAGIKRLLASHPMVDPDPARVRFIGFGNFSLDVEIFAFVNTTDFNEYLGVQEDLLLRLMELVNDSGSGFAFPSSTTYLGKDSGLNLERQQKAEAQVRTWREEGRLPFPSFTPEALAEMDDTLDYPPKGSAVAPTQPL